MRPPRRWFDRGALSRYWNALVTGAPDDVLAPLAAALDDEQLAVIARLRGRQRYQPDPAFVAQLERELLRDLAIAGANSVPLRAVAPPAANGGVPPRSFRLPPVREPHRWSWAPVTTALLVVFALLAVYLAVIRPQEPPVIVPNVAPDATPATPAVEASPVPGATPAVATPEVPFWRTVPPPQVGASVVWQIEGPQSTGTGLSSQISVDATGNLWVTDGVNGRFQIYDQDGVLVDTWGEAGSGEAQFAFQRANGEVVGNLAFTPLHVDGPFYVADSQNARIQVFDSERNFLRSWGGRGTGDGQFLEPVSVWVSFEGLVFVLDAQRADVQIFDTDGAFIRKLGGPGDGEGQFNNPGWGAISDHGLYWVADTGNHRLQEFNCCNPVLDPFAYVATIDGAGSNESQLNQPQFLAFDEDFRVYVVDRGAHRVAIFLDDGRFVNLIDGSEAGGSAFVNPGGVALSREGLNSFLYVLDDDGTNVTVQKFRLILP